MSSRLLRTLLAAATVAGLVTAAPAAPRPASAAGVAAQPQRLVDTRSAQRLSPGQTLRIAAPAASSAGASAVTVNLTATDATDAGYLTAWPCGQPMPATSVLNFRPGHPEANLVALGFTGEICVASSAPVHVIADLMGWFTGNADFRGSTPTRLLDTRGGDPLTPFQPRALSVAGAVGAGAAAIAINVTITAPMADGYAVAYPCGTTPPNSTVNFRAGEDVAALTLVSPSNGSVCFLSSAPAHLVVDGFGWAPSGSGLATQAAGRLLDTRQSSWPYGPAQSGSTLTVQVSSRGGVPNNAGAAFLTITAVDAGASGYVTIWPCDQPLPTASILNTWAGSLRANLAYVKLSEAGTVCIQAHSDAGTPVQLIVDVVGNTGGGPNRAVPPAAPTPPTTPPTATPTAHFSTLPPGSALPSGAECAARVRDAAEIKPRNAPYNTTTWSSRAVGFPLGDRADGKFTGTTDEILQWVACKWGIDEDIVRAQVAKESGWNQDALGDRTGQNCAPFVVQTNPCGESIGLMQVRWYYHQAAFEGAVKSSAYNVDYAYATWRSCYEGYTTWLGASYAGGDLWGCVGQWFSGAWHTSAAETYIAAVKDYLAQRVWEGSTFPSW